MVEELQAVVRLGPVRMAVDAGAHYGEWSVGLASRSATVHAIEPNPKTLAELKSAVARCGVGQHVCVHEFALSDVDGEAEMFVDCPSTVASIDPRWPAEEFPGNYLSRATVKVRCLRWASFVREAAILRPIDVLKLDCEGLDARILADLAETGPWPSRVVAEVCGRGTLGEELARAEALLFPLGYERVADWSLDGEKGRTNRLYVRKP